MYGACSLQHLASIIVASIKPDYILATTGIMTEVFHAKEVGYDPRLLRYLHEIRWIERLKIFNETKLDRTESDDSDMSTTLFL